MRGARLVAIVVLASLIGAGGGYWLAWKRHAPPPPRSMRMDLPPGGLAAAVQRSLTNPDRIRGVGELSDLLASSGPEALDEIRTGFESVFLDVAEIEVVLLAEWWAAFDPRAAFEWTQQTRVANQAMVVRTVVRAWARRDPLAARDGVGMILDPITQRASLDALVAGWDESGEGGVVEYIRSLPLSIEQLLAITSLARRRVLELGPEAAFAWAEAQPEDTQEDASRFKLQLFRRIASAAASVDLERAAAWAGKHADGPNGDGLLGRVGNTWSTRDGAAAMVWLASLPPSPVRDRGIEDTYRSWLGWHRDAAVAWFASAPQEPWMEPLYALYAVAIADDDPQQALAWAQRVSDPEQRDMAVVAVARAWRQKAPEAAAAWIELADLSPAVREQILAPLASGTPIQPDLDTVVPGDAPPPRLPTSP